MEEDSKSLAFKIVSQAFLFLGRVPGIMKRLSLCARKHKDNKERIMKNNTPSLMVKAISKGLILATLILCLPSVAIGIDVPLISTIVETVTTPNIPSGSINGNASLSYIYTIKGSSSNLGDPIQYFIHWGDGTNTGWVPSSSNITSPDTNYLVSKSWTSPGIYSVKAKARCAIHTTIESAWSETLLVTISIAETISTPSIQGPTSGIVNTSYTYTASASSNVGHQLEYRFDWGEGSYTDWSPSGVSKSWSSPGSYTVKAQARCAQDTVVVSNWSDGLSVNIQTSGWKLINSSVKGSLFGVHFTSSSEGWAVGSDGSYQVLVLHYLNGSWEKVSLPNVSSFWHLRGVHFISPDDGWAVGPDYQNNRGILLHYLNGTWSAVNPPNVNSSNWYLSRVYFTAPDEGWAVGTDSQNNRGVLLHYLDGVWESLNTPILNVDWGLSDINFVSSNEGWAVGSILLHYLDGSWSYVSSPNVAGAGIYFTSPNEGWVVGGATFFHYLNGSWEILSSPIIGGRQNWQSVHFTSSKEGWAVGVRDFSPGRISTGGLLHYLNGTWVEVIPDMSSLGGSFGSYWGLLDVYFTSPDEGWAVGDTYGALEGVGVVVLLKYSAASPEIISAPTTLNGATSGITNNSYSYSTGGSASSLGHSVQYFFDWGDGTNSGWLPVGTTSASKSWSSAGTYSVKTQARCSADTSIISDWSPGLTVNILAPMTLQSPSDGTRFGACSLYSPLTFSWTVGETFKGYEIQFSPDSSFSSIPVRVRTTAIQATVTSSTWKRVLSIPGGTVYWRVVGTQANRTKFTSEFRSIIIDPAQAVGNPNISSTSKGSPPELSWENNCNTKFKVWFGSDEQFTKKKTFAFNITNPNDNEGEFMKVLTFGQWMAVRRVVKDASGSTIYWYVESWDGLKRYNKTDVMSFVLTD